MEFFGDWRHIIATELLLSRVGLSYDTGIAYAALETIASKQWCLRWTAQRAPDFLKFRQLWTLILLQQHDKHGNVGVQQHRLTLWWNISMKVGCFVLEMF